MLKDLPQDIQKETNNLFKYVKNYHYEKTNMVYSFNEVLKKYKDLDLRFAICNLS